MTLRFIYMLIISALLMSCTDYKWDNPVDTDLDITPKMSIAAGEYNNPITISFTNAQANLQIRYTTDGSLPTSVSTLYTTPVVLSGPQATTLQAKAFADQNSSAMISMAYTFRVANPLITLVAGTYYHVQFVDISCTTVGAEIRYTVDNSDPSTSLCTLRRSYHS